MLFEVAVSPSTRPGRFNDSLTVAYRQARLLHDFPIGETVEAATDNVTITCLPVDLVLNQYQGHEPIVAPSAWLSEGMVSRESGTISRAPTSGN